MVMDMEIKLRPQNQECSSSLKLNTVMFTHAVGNMVAVTIVSILTCVLALYLWHVCTRRKQNREEVMIENQIDDDGREDLPLFYLKTIANATDNFSNNFKLGEGCFGPVYKNLDSCCADPSAEERSGFEGPWTTNPLIFDNSYFTELLTGEKEGLLQFPTDKSLLEDPVFCPLVDKYADIRYFSDFVFGIT
ncbi:uncharacterized protein LOC141672989 isoform X2 [Apium graveolens]|uniref:uncharacterized protein LOC141672989 isoform X2 n=1 Tax=Apium graveolens TaxID=4045 RepID=UPI003D7AEB9A